MYLHLGQDTVIKMDEIVGIFNMETSTISKTTRNYLAQAEKAGKVVNVRMELPKSFVLCRDSQNRETVYISQISSSTLLKRRGTSTKFPMFETVEGEHHATHASKMPALRETGQLVPRMGSENTGGIPLREMRRMLERRAG